MPDRIVISQGRVKCKNKNGEYTIPMNGIVESESAESIASLVSNTLQDANFMRGTFDPITRTLSITLEK